MPPTPKLATLTVEAYHEPGWVSYKLEKNQGGTPSWVIEHRCYDTNDDLVYSDAKGVYWADGKHGDMQFFGGGENAVRAEAWAHAIDDATHLSNDLSYTLPL